MTPASPPSVPKASIEPLAFQASAVTGIAVVATLAHSADARRDQRITLAQRGAGEFAGTVEVSRGFWDLIIDASRDGTDMFRSRSRVLLQ